MRPSLRGATTCCPTQWSTSPAKRLRYAQESYFVEAFTELSHQVDGAIDQVPTNKTFVIFKPDAAALRSVELAIAILAEHALRPIYATLFTFDRLLFRELWRYELNASTYERYPAVDALLSHCPSLFVLLEQDSAVESRSAACHLSAFKGPSSQYARQPHHLRARINAGDGVLNNIHTPEDMADIIREIGVLFDSSMRVQVLKCLCALHNPVRDIGEDIATFYSGTATHTLSITDIREKLFPTLRENEFQLLLEEFGMRRDFSVFWSEVVQSNPTTTWWDAVVLFVSQRSFVVDGVAPLLEFEDAQPHAINW